jgi:hypothetical protein
VARAAGVPLDEVAITDERIGAIVLSGPEARAPCMRECAVVRFILLTRLRHAHACDS